MNRALLLLSACLISQTAARSEDTGLPNTYDLKTDDGAFRFSGISFSGRTGPMFDALAKNDTTRNWESVIFTVSITLRDGSASTFRAYPIQADQKIFVGSTYSVKSEALSDIYTTGKDVVAFSIFIDGKWRAYRSMPAYEGLIFEDDCIGDVGRMLATESGLERRKKLLEMMSVGCAKSTEGPYAVIMMPLEMRSFGPPAAKRIFVKVHLSNIDRDVSTMTGWIEKDAIGSHEFAEVKVYSSTRSGAK